MMRIPRREVLALFGSSAALVTFPRWARAAAPPPNGPTGLVVRPGEPAYEEARAIYNSRFDIHPALILFAESADDVAWGIQWARAQAMPFRIRSGRHSYEAFSVVEGGLVIDVSALDEVKVERDTNGQARAWVGAGVELIGLYEALWDEGLTLPGGSCPTVGIAGLTLGGGFGLLARSRGLTCDNLLEVELVNGRGKRLRASPHHHPELFWALRGGGGGNFGAVTAFCFRVAPIGNVAIYSVRWTLQELPQVVQAWQSWAPAADRRLVSILQLTPAGITSSGQFDGTAAELQAALAPLLSAGAPTHLFVEELPFIDAVRSFGGLRPQRPELEVSQRLDHASFKNTSAYGYEPLGPAAIQTMVEHLQMAPGPNNILQLDAHGGAVRDVPTWATAYFHRQALFSLQFQGYWTRPQDAAANIAWVTGFRAALSPHTRGAYVNYIDAALPNWEKAYYGPHFPVLRFIKSVHDPDNSFEFPQSIPPL